MNVSRSASEPREGLPHERSRERMNDHSKFIGYITLGVLLAVFVAWIKFGLVSNYAFWIAAISTVGFFIGFRVFTGTWPGNDARR